MLLKPGVDISKLHRPIRRTLEKVDRIFAEHQEELVITSTYAGDHAPSSLHYCHDAYDCREPKQATIRILDRIRAMLGQDYDIVVKQFHFHIEYDPKGEK